MGQRTGTSPENSSEPPMRRQCLAAVIHRLKPGDERRLQELCCRFKERVPSDNEAASLLAREDIYVWVADVDGELAGFAYAYVLDRIDGDTSRRGLTRAALPIAASVLPELPRDADRAGPPMGEGCRAEHRLSLGPALDDSPSSRGRCGERFLPSLCTDERDRHTRQLRIFPEVPPRVIAAVWRADRHLAPPAAALVAAAREVSAELAPTARAS
jgi:hypothetical protein